jgi:hypothetical protein
MYWPNVPNRHFSNSTPFKATRFIARPVFNKNHHGNLKYFSEVCRNIPLYTFTVLSVNSPNHPAR